MGRKGDVSLLPSVHGMLHASDGAVVSFHKNALYDHGISPNKLFDYCLFAPRSVMACDQRALAGLEDLVTLHASRTIPLVWPKQLVPCFERRNVRRRNASKWQSDLAIGS